MTNLKQFLTQSIQKFQDVTKEETQIKGPENVCNNIIEESFLA